MCCRVAGGRSTRSKGRRHAIIQGGSAPRLQADIVLSPSYRSSLRYDGQADGATWWLLRGVECHAAEKFTTLLVVFLKAAGGYHAAYPWVERTLSSRLLYVPPLCLQVPLLHPQAGRRSGSQSPPLPLPLAIPAASGPVPDCRPRSLLHF